jgi:peptidoglycan-associated lipoprotein
LTAQARWLRANPAVRARIEGHADERTPRDHALALGERRADAVRDFLVLQGVPSWQLTVTSWGKERPAVGGTSEMALALNRRVKTVLMR